MRLAPVVMYFYPNSEAISHYARESSRTTHGTLECLDGCQLLAEYLRRAIQGFDKPEVLAEVADNFKAARINIIAKGGWRDKSLKEIRGRGYVVECLEAAIWCFDTTDSFDKAILKAANLGDDADTTAAVCGQIAGAYYGASAVLNLPLGARDGSQATFKSDEMGRAEYKVSFSPCLQFSGAQFNTLLAIAWHSDNKTYGASPGPLSTVSHVQLLSTPFPNEDK